MPRATTSWRLCAALLLGSPLFADVISLNDGWRFRKGDAPGAAAADFDDAAWSTVDLPHDWSIDGPDGTPSAQPPQDPTTADGQSVGYLHGGVGWYRLHLAPSAVPEPGGAELIIDGAQQETDLWVNGTHVAFQPHGYIPIRSEIGPLLRPARENVIAIRVLNPESNSRWYSGSGLYRSVELRRHRAVYLPTWGAQVDTVWLAAPRALLQTRVTVCNDDSIARDLVLACRLTSPSGQTSEHPLGVVRLSAGQSEIVNAKIDLDEAEPWAPATPQRYAAEFTVSENGRVLDTLPASFGVRTIHVDSTRGLLLNGTPLKLRGACVHHDNGILGAAAFPAAELRRVRLLKANGFNAIRTSHNPPSAAFLAACDREGLLVIDEFTDAWELPKKLNGYQRYFDAHWEHDLGATIARDFNHPSVIMWSIGNEIPERHNPAGIAIGRRLVDFVHRADPRRPVTNAICSIWEIPNVTDHWTPNYPALDLLDVGGYNYTWREYRSDHEQAPRWVMAETESYPMEARETWRDVEALPYVIGDFVWTGIDYIGESGIGHSSYIDADADPETAKPSGWELMPWPCWISWCGDLDITGVKKPQSYYRDVVWGRSAIELAVHEPVSAGKKEKVGAWGWPAELPQWTWPVEKGTPLQVSVYSSAPHVKLVLNGRTVGEANIDQARTITAKFSVPYEPGTLTAIAFDGTNEIGRRALTTPGAPRALRASAETSAAPASRGTVVFVPISVADGTNATVPDAAVPITCQVTGEAELQALGTGNPTQIESLTDSATVTFRGRALAILRSTGRAGTATLKISAPGLRDAMTTVVFEQPDSKR